MQKLGKLVGVEIEKMKKESEKERLSRSKKAIKTSGKLAEKELKGR